MTLSTPRFDKYAETKRRAAFLAEIGRVAPWAELCALIEPVYPKLGNGCPSVGLERLLRIYFLQHWFYLSDQGPSLMTAPRFFSFASPEMC